MQLEQVKVRLEQVRALLQGVRIFNAISFLTNFEIQKYCQNDEQLSSKNEPKFNGVFSRYNLSEIKDGTYVINLDEYNSTEIHWMALYVYAENVTYFDSFGVARIPKELKNSWETKI